MIVRMNDLHLVDDNGDDLGHIVDFARNPNNSPRIAAAKAALDIFAIDQNEEIAARQRVLNTNRIEIEAHKAAIDTLTQKAPLDIRTAIADAIATEVAAAVEIITTNEAIKLTESVKG